LIPWQLARLGRADAGAAAVIPAATKAPATTKIEYGVC
jgi:hypothetical protein